MRHQYQPCRANGWNDGAILGHQKFMVGLVGRKRLYAISSREYLWYLLRSSLPGPLCLIRNREKNGSILCIRSQVSLRVNTVKVVVFSLSDCFVDCRTLASR